MGLDSYVQKEVTKPDGKTESEELWYGRKIGELHGWMQRHSGLLEMEFNCKRLYLTAELLDELEKDVKQGMEHTAGFFFGSANEKKYVREQATYLIKVAREALVEDSKPYYYSWW